MKKTILLITVILMITALMTGCNGAQSAPATEPTAAATEAPAPAQPATEAPAPTELEEEEYEYEGDASTYYIDVAYAKQIGRYYDAISQQWTEEQLLENEMSPLIASYYEGNGLDNLGFGFVDLDNDGYWELILGAIENCEADPAVFEIWTLVDGEPVMVAQGGSRNRYYLTYAEEDNAWYVANEAENGAANSAIHYLMLFEGKFDVVQAVVFDALANPDSPWFMAYDCDWDTSNDEAIDEELAMSIMNAYRNTYTAIEYFPYSLYR